MKEWWKTFFDKIYLETYEGRGTFKHTRQEVNFLEKNVLRKGDRILDLCCGHGRHSLELAKRGFSVTGLDYSKFELDIARKEAKKRHLRIDFCQGDARRFRFRKKFDVVINMFTSFGYNTLSEDRKIIQNVRKNLVRGGRFFIDLMSFVWLMRHYQGKKRRKEAGYNVLYESEFDFLISSIKETRIVSKGNFKKVYKGSHRVFTLPEITSLLASHGLKTIKVWGSFQGEPYGFSTKRMLVLAKKVR